MGKIYGSSVALDSYDSFAAIEFFDCIRDLLYSESVQQLDLYAQHLNTSRLQHSLNVAYYSYQFCKLFHLDYRSAARAGLLHDLYHYDWRDGQQPEGNHVFAHPVVALRNAESLTELNEIEKDSIVNHMWPMSKSMPRFVESYVVSLADKWACTFEISAAIARFFRKAMQEE